MDARHPKVLLVDDDPAILRLLSKWLQTAGYQTEQAKDGRAATEIIEADCPSIVITDWEMPGMDGLELCHWLRQQQLPRYVYTLILTVRSGHDNMVQGLEAGADDFLKKPVDKGELLARLRAGLRVLELESRLSLLARTDPLTGLATQRTFYEEFAKEWARSVRHHFPVSCVMADIDFFKQINDKYGHLVGDEVLREVANVFSRGCRSSDLLCRYGGEEFCVLLPETDEQNAAIWAQRIRNAISKTEILVHGEKIHVTASFGVAERLDDTDSPEGLADQALLMSKQTGRDRVVTFQSINDTEWLQSLTAGTLFGGISAKHVMTMVMAGLKQNDSVGSAAQYLLRFRINSAPVVDDDGQLVGILSEKDVMSIVLQPNWWKTKIKDLMQTNVVCYEEDTLVLVIYEFLCRVSIRGVIIVKDSRPTGVISRASLLRWFSNVLAARFQTGGNDTEQNLLSEELDPRLRLATTARMLAEEATRLESALREQNDDLISCVVGGASKVQELTNDLLAYSRYLNDSPGPLLGSPLESGQDMLPEGLVNSIPYASDFTGSIEPKPWLSGDAKRNDSATQ